MKRKKPRASWSVVGIPGVQKKLCLPPIDSQFSLLLLRSCTSLRTGGIPHRWCTEKTLSQKLTGHQMLKVGSLRAPASLGDVGFLW